MFACALGATSAGAINSDAAAAGPASGAALSDARALDSLLGALPARYASAQPTHEVALAAQDREGVRAAELLAQQLSASAAPAEAARVAGLSDALQRLEAALDATSARFQPWPLTLEVRALATAAERRLQALALGVAPSEHKSPSSRDTVGAALAQAQSAAQGGSSLGARVALLRAYAFYVGGQGQRLSTADATLDGKIAGELLDAGLGRQAPGRTSQGSQASQSGQGDQRGQGGQAMTAGQGSADAAQAVKAAEADLHLAAEVLGEVHIARATIVVNGAIIVFREGLEAVLILAAITASFVGARRHLRRPVLIGAFLGLGATLLTWLVAQAMLHMFGDGGLRLQAVTGVIAIGVLLLVTNWFFHRVYWSEWIARFNRRRKALERWDGIGFVSGQVLGFVLLGLSSVYREGLETVLFLQALQTSAGTGATALGAGIGLGATLVVGVLTFKLQRRLPFKRMLILTGVLIALVLMVMVGTTVHNLQGVGWVPTTPTAFVVPTAWSTWLGVYGTWQGIGAQLGSLVFVLGSYFAARELQVKRPRRRAAAEQVAHQLPRRTPDFSTL